MLGYSIYKLLATTGYQLLFTQTASERVYPRLYLKAALETIILALLVTWTFTLWWDPNQVWQHPAYITLGAFNFCFAWCAMAYLAPTMTSRLSLPLSPARAHPAVVHLSQGLCAGKLHRSLYELVHRLLPLATQFS